MADRYFHVDTEFMFKRTADKLIERFGHSGLLVFLALCARAKTSSTPGSFIYESEPAAWEKLGFEGHRPDFALDEFLSVTGRMKQTSRRRVGRLSHVTLTQYGRWQKDAWRQTERERKSRNRGKSERDTSGTEGGTPSGTGAGQRTRTRTTPQTPLSGKNGTHPHDCPICGNRQPSKSAVEDHIRIFHQEPVAVAALGDDDIPF